jgi:regulator of sigma E protease
LKKGNLIRHQNAICITGIPETLKQDITTKDIVLSLNGQPAKYDQVIPILESNKGKTITATVLRDEKKYKP